MERKRRSSVVLGQELLSKSVDYNDTWYNTSINKPLADEKRNSSITSQQDLEPTFFSQFLKDVW